MANAQKIVNGSLESPLSDVGRRQASISGLNAKHYFAFDLIVSSPLARALETAQIIADAVGHPKNAILILKELHERSLGQLEGQHYADIPELIDKFGDTQEAPGAEPLEDLFIRAGHALSLLQNRPEQHILIVCHNGIGRMLQIAARNGRPMEFYHQPRLENAIIYRLSKQK